MIAAKGIGHPRLSIHRLIRWSGVGSVANDPCYLGQISSRTTAKVSLAKPHEMQPRIWIWDCP